MRTAYAIKDLDWEIDKNGDLFAKTPFVEYQVSANDFDDGYDLIISTPLSISQFIGCEYFDTERNAQIGAVVHFYGLLAPIMTDVSEYIEWL